MEELIHFFIYYFNDLFITKTNFYINIHGVNATYKTNKLTIVLKLLAFYYLLLPFHY